MASIRIISYIALFLIINNVAVTSEFVLEEGYTVTTVLDGNKIGVNPHSILPLYTSSQFVLLDSSRSQFYTLSSPISQESVIERLAGNGSAGFIDGDLGSSTFSKPKSFAIDLKGNVYVADKGNHVIRKITNSGVTTIAGGLSRKAGHADGPAQQASFSDDFEFTFVPGMCALLISDHGNKLVRQIDLKREDCHMGSHSVLGATGVWILGMGISCILGLIGGFVLHPYITSHGGPRLLSLMQIWNLCPIRLGKQAVTFCFDARNAIANSTPYIILRKFFFLNLSCLSRVLGFNIVNFKPAHVHPVSLMDSDVVSTKADVKQLDKFASQLKDLITFDGCSETLQKVPCPTLGHKDLTEVTSSFTTSHGKSDTLETMMHAHLMDFVTKIPKPIPENSEPANSVNERRKGTDSY